MMIPNFCEGDSCDGEEHPEWVRNEVDRFAPMQPWPLTMGQVLEMLEPDRLAKFMHVEVPVRFAERIRWIEEIPDWEKVPELVDVHGDHWRAFHEMRLVKRKPTLDQFTEVVKRVATSMQDMRHVLGLAMQRLSLERGDEYGSGFADPWLDKFLLNHLGTDMLMAQYLGCVKAAAAGIDETSMAGIIDPRCDVAKLCREVANEVLEICDSETGLAPLVKVETFSAFGEDKGVPRFSFIPGYLRFMVREVLKNSCRATAVKARSQRELTKKPINIVVCADGHRVAIRVTDRAGGIPFDVGKDVWSYLFSTTGKGAKFGKKATPLAGYGMGLPLSRLYARYLGGSLRVVSLPGYGTSVDIFLSRVSSEQMELVPDEDNEPDVLKRGLSLSQPDTSANF